MAGRKIKVAITHGDINGISYELLLKVFADERIAELCTPILYGAQGALEAWQELLQLEQPTQWQLISSPAEAVEGKLNLIECATAAVELHPGQARPEAGMLAFAALERATADLRAGLCDVLVTAPINKSVMPKQLFPFQGHTDYLESLAAVDPGKSLMVLGARDCRIALATTHIALQDVASQLSEELILSKLQLLEQGLQRDFGIIKPRLAVLALNPHAGDGGLMGHEEAEIIRPALTKADEAGLLAFGPYPGDGFWGSAQVDCFDGILAMYHDQGLAPFKALYMNEGVNVTLGLQYVRTSPDHGTGYDIAGQGIADPTSMRCALYWALDCYRCRQRYDEATRRPLRRYYHNKGRDDERLDFSSVREDY